MINIVSQIVPMQLVNSDKDCEPGDLHNCDLVSFPGLRLLEARQVQSCRDPLQTGSVTVLCQSEKMKCH